MTLLRTSALLARASPRSAFPSNVARAAPFSTRSGLFAGSSYGGGEGDPKGENPQEQGAQKSSDLEHPGPPPPDVGKGTGGGPTKATKRGHEGAGAVASNSSISSSSASSSSSGSSSGNETPKIHKPTNPNEQSDQSEQVKKHNAEFEKRHDRSSNKLGDDQKVDKKFWSGQD